MTFDFINPLMLVGLAGMALPVLAHLLSKKRYDVVSWGAMQFLKLGRNARRRLRLEELLLLAVRMGLIALLAIALARPWVAGGFLANHVSKQSRDVVLVVDGSYSMGWEGDQETPHAAAVQRAHEFLEDLDAGDTVALIDAREQPRVVIESPTSDLGRVRESLNHLPPPAGSTDLAEAVATSLQMLTRTSNLGRDVIVLTDGQAKGWQAGDRNLWARIDDLRQLPTVLPKIWGVNARSDNAGSQSNFSVDRLEMSRELTVVDFPLRITTCVRQSGGHASVNRRVFLEIDGQRLAEKTLSVQVPSDGEAIVEFDYRFRFTGSHVVSVVLEPDSLPGDDRADAAVRVADALPVLLVDGDPRTDPTRSETFFAKTAMTAVSNETPWIKATVVPWDQFDSSDLNDAEVVLVANVPRFTKSQVGALKDFVAHGGGVCLTLGDKVEQGLYNSTLFASEDGLFPVQLDRVAADTDDTLPGVYISDTSLELPWLTHFHRIRGGGFADARFSRWWSLKDPGPEIRIPSQKEGRPAGTDVTEQKRQESAPVVEVTLDTGDPLLLTARLGRGQVALWTSSLDADWNTLPAKPDYVSFLHELIFRLSAGQTVRNVKPGTPLLCSIPPETRADEYVFIAPDGMEFAAEPAGDELRPRVRFTKTHLPGVYTLRREEPADNGVRFLSEQFVVDFDRSESDLRPLDQTERVALEAEGRMTFIQERQELSNEMFADDSQAEIWHLLLFVFLAILIAEVFMTRRLVQKGHAAVNEETLREFV